MRLAFIFFQCAKIILFYDYTNFFLSFTVLYHILHSVTQCFILLLKDTLCNSVFVTLCNSVFENPLRSLWLKPL